MHRPHCSQSPTFLPFSRFVAVVVSFVECTRLYLLKLLPPHFVLCGFIDSASENPVVSLGIGGGVEKGLVLLFYSRDPSVVVNRTGVWGQRPTG